AEDGIRDRNVTGVQTCALPIFPEEKDTRTFSALRKGTLAPAAPGGGGVPRGSISAALNGSSPRPCRRPEHRPSWAGVVDHGRGHCRTDVHTRRPPLGNTVLVRIDRPQGWVHGGAHLLRDRTTRSKHTSRRWVC